MSSGQRINDVLKQIQGEFLELPELRLTRSQAQRLWHLDGVRCEPVLMALVDAHFLSRTPDGAFVRRPPDAVA